jgi:hypothetical protein
LGRNVTVESREGDEQPTLAADLIRQHVTVMPVVGRGRRFNLICDFMQEAHPHCPCSFISFLLGGLTMTKTAILLTLIVTALASMPAHAQRVFVSGHGLDTNPCTVTQPCRTFQQAYNTAPANGEIDVIDPAGYGPLTITHGISIQAHGFGGITQIASCIGCAAITISVTTSDPVTLNGLLLDGAGTGTVGINITSGPSVQILNSVIRHFAGDGILDLTNTIGANLLIEDTVASDNGGIGIVVFPSGVSTQATAQVTLNRSTANNNSIGVGTATANVTIANSVMSNNNIGLRIDTGIAWLAKKVISGNNTGVLVLAGTVRTYGDNYLNDNGTPGGPLTPVSTQ